MIDTVKLFEQLLEQIKESIELANNIKVAIANYKKNIDLLDDCIFIEVLDELAEYKVDIKKFDELLNKEDLTESEQIYVSYMIDFNYSLIREHIINKIQQLKELLDNF